MDKLTTAANAQKNKRNISLDRVIELLKMLDLKGGPTSRDDVKALRFISKKILQLRKGPDHNESRFQSRLEGFPGLRDLDGMHGFAFQKPHGYSGDFEIIDRIYRGKISLNPKITNWDRYFHQTPIAKATRNRKAYIKSLISRLAITHSTPLKILSIASGSCREVYELKNETRMPLLFTCLDSNAQAIQYARSLLGGYTVGVKFLNRKLMSFGENPKDVFDVAFSIDLLNSINDELFIQFLRRFISTVRERGLFILGNMSPTNPNRFEMEALLNWEVFYRSEEHLLDLAGKAGFSSSQISVESEPFGIHHFLIIRK